MALEHEQLKKEQINKNNSFLMLKPTTKTKILIQIQQTFWLWPFSIYLNETLTKKIK